MGTICAGVLHIVCIASTSHKAKGMLSGRHDADLHAIRITLVFNGQRRKDYDSRKDYDRCSIATRCSAS